MWSMNRFTVLASALLLVGCEYPVPRIAKSIELVPDSLSFDAIGDSGKAIATVKDQFGDALNAPVRWTLNSGHAAISPSDTARVVWIKPHVTPGSVHFTVTSGLARMDLAATVTQKPSMVTKDFGGDNQTGPGGSVLPRGASVSVRDRNGNRIVPYDRVLWIADSGGQAVGVFGSDNIGPLGVRWRLGPATTPVQHLTATVAGVGSVTFTATAFETDQNRYASRSLTKLQRSSLPFTTNPP